MVEQGVIFILLAALAIYWITPFILLIVAAFMYRSNPTRAKNFMVTALIMLLVGIGVCGSLMM